MTDKITKAEASLEDAQRALAEAQEMAAQAAAALLTAQDAYDTALIEQEGEVNPHQDQIDRMAYIQSQAEQRAARFGVAAKLRETAPPASDLDPRSQLDKAMKGNRSRGQSRPKVEKAAD